MLVLLKTTGQAPVWMNNGLNKTIWHSYDSKLIGKTLWIIIDMAMWQIKNCYAAYLFCLFVICLVGWLVDRLVWFVFITKSSTLFQMSLNLLLLGRYRYYCLFVISSLQIHPTLPLDQVRTSYTLLSHMFTLWHKGAKQVYLTTWVYVLVFFMLHLTQCLMDPKVLVYVRICHLQSGGRG